MKMFKEIMQTTCQEKHIQIPNTQIYFVSGNLNKSCNNLSLKFTFLVYLISIIVVILKLKINIWFLSLLIEVSYHLQLIWTTQCCYQLLNWKVNCGSKCGLRIFFLLIMNNVIIIGEITDRLKQINTHTFIYDSTVSTHQPHLNV